MKWVIAVIAALSPIAVAVVNKVSCDGNAPPASAAKEPPVAQQPPRDPPPQKATAAGLVLSYRVLAKRPADDAFRVLEPGSAVPSNTRIVFEVQLSEPAYLYLSQRPRGKRLVTLFPNPKLQLTNPLPATTWIRIPPGTSYRLNDRDIGNETVYIVAARKRLHNLTRAVTSGSDAGPQIVEDELIAVAMNDRPDCLGRPRALVLDADDNCAPRVRGLELEDSAVAAPRDRSSRRVRTSPADDIVLVPFVFNHSRE